MNSRHPGPRRVWMGGFELRGRTSVPLAAAGCRWLRLAAAGCGWLPLAAAGVFQDPQLLTTLPLISATWLGRCESKTLHDNSFARVFADSSMQNHTFLERPRSCQGNKNSTMVRKCRQYHKNYMFLPKFLRRVRELPWSFFLPEPILCDSSQFLVFFHKHI